MIFLDLVMNCIHKNEWIYCFKRSILPCSHIGHNLLTYLADKLGRDFYIIQIFDLFGNITLAHSAGVEWENFLFHTVCIAVVFADYFGLVFAVSIPRNFDFKLSHLRFYRLFRVAVSVIFRLIATFIIRRSFAFLIAEFIGKLTFHNLLKNVLEHIFHRCHNFVCWGEILTSYKLSHHFCRCFCH